MTDKKDVAYRIALTELNRLLDYAVAGHKLKVYTASHKRPRLYFKRKEIEQLRDNDLILCIFHREKCSIAFLIQAGIIKKRFRGDTYQPMFKHVAEMAGADHLVKRL